MRYLTIIITIITFLSFSNCKKDAKLQPKEYPYLITNGANVLEDGSVIFEAEILNFEDIGSIDEYGFEITQPGNITNIIVGQDESIRKFRYELRTGIEKNKYYEVRAYSLYKGIKVLGPAISFISIGSSSIKITSPKNFCSLPVNEINNFEVTVYSDLLETYNNLTIELKSDKDGKLAQGHPDNNGNIKFNIQNLSPQVHYIQAILSDSKGFIAMDSIQVSTTISLTKQELVERNVILEWTEIENSNFDNYEIVGLPQQGNEYTIARIYDRKTTFYIDKLPPFVQSIDYFIRLNLKDGNSINSNSRRTLLPCGQLLNFRPYTTLIHSNEAFLYILKQDYYNSTITKYNYLDSKIEKVISVPDEIGYCSFGNNGHGNELYLPGNSSIYIYSADDMLLLYQIETGLRTKCVETSNLGFLIASVYNGANVDLPVRTYNRENRTLLSGNGEWGGDRLRFIPGKMQALSISTSVVPEDMEYFTFSESGEILSHLDDNDHGNILDPYIFRISDNGEYAITSRDGVIYGTDSKMSYIGDLEGSGFSDFCFSRNGDTIYAAQNQKIIVFEYPSLSKIREIKTRGIPVFIERKEDTIIAVSWSTVDHDFYGVELIKLE